MESKDDDLLLTTAQVCERLQISRATLSRWHAAGKITRYEVGGTYRYRLSEILNKTSN